MTIQKQFVITVFTLIRSYHVCNASGGCGVAEAWNSTSSATVITLHEY